MASFKGEYGTVEHDEDERYGMFYAYRNVRPDVNWKDCEFCQFSMTEEEFMRMIEFFATDKVHGIYREAADDIKGLLEKLDRLSGLLKELEIRKTEELEAAVIVMDKLKSKIEGE
jgi:hypothetical protein